MWTCQTKMKMSSFVKVKTSFLRLPAGNPEDGEIRTSIIQFMDLRYEDIIILGRHNLTWTQFSGKNIRLPV